MKISKIIYSAIIASCLFPIFSAAGMQKADVIYGWEDATLKGGSNVYSTNGGSEEVLTLERSVISNKFSRVIARVDLSEYSDCEFIKDGILKYKLKTKPKNDAKVYIYSVSTADADWKSAEDSRMGNAAWGYACAAQKKRDSDRRGGTLGYYKDRTDDGIAWSGGYIMGNPGGGSYEPEPIAEATVHSDADSIEFVIPKAVLTEWATLNNNGFVIKLETEKGAADKIEMYSSNSAFCPPTLSFEYIGKNFNILSFSVVNNDGEEIKTLDKGLSGVNVFAEVENQLLKKTSPAILCVVYDENKKIKLIKKSDTTTIEREEKKTIGMSFNSEELSELSHGDILEVMLWEDGTLYPYMNKKTYRQTLQKITASNFAAINGTQQNMDEIGLTLTRHDFSWESIEPKKGIFDENTIKKWGDMILNAKENGITFLPILDYTASWAAMPEAYSYDYRLDGSVVYECGPVKTVDGQRCRDIRVLTNGEETEFNQNVPVSPSKEPFANVEDWKRYVEKVVSTYSKAPYNVEYFQIWNEASPISGFFNGDMVWYIENVHKPAAEIIRKYGCKAVYGGWPCCNGIYEYVSLLDKTDAWDSIDIFDMHYFSIGSVIYFYNEALKRGIVSPCVWQTEIGFTTDTEYIARNYPIFLYESLKRRSMAEDQFRFYYFTYWAPNDPNAYGYGCNLYHGDYITNHGKAMKTFTEVMDGDEIEIYTAVKSETGQGYECNLRNSLSGFKIDSMRVVAHINSDNAEKMQGKRLYFEGVRGFKSAMLKDLYGENSIPLRWVSTGEYSGYVTVPDDYEYEVFYVIIEADKIISPKNNILDFERGTDAYGKSIIAGGRWSYLGDDLMPLERGTGINAFSEDEWAIDNYNKPEHAWCLNSEGNVYTDSRMIYYNYTLDESSSAVVIRGNVSGNGADKILEIYKTDDTDEFTVGKEKKLLYSLNFNDNREFEFEIPADEVKSGNDICFGIRSEPGSTWSIPAVLDADIIVK